MRSIRKPLAIAAIATAALLSVGTAVTHHAAATRTLPAKAAQTAVATTEPVVSVVLPNCEDIAPVFDGGDFTGSCLMWDEDAWQLRVVDTDGIGDGAPYPTCATEDSVSCVWDASTQGNGQGSGLVLNP